MMINGLLRLSVYAISILMGGFALALPVTGVSLYLAVGGLSGIALGAALLLAGAVCLLVLLYGMAITREW
jgi:hypothetical protein